MRRLRTNIVLIGMAGCGKSTIGNLLAKKLDLDFVDTDNLFELSFHKPLQDILDDLGSDEFRKAEEQILLDIQLYKHVIATGGSSVYSDRGMAHLHNSGVVVWLDVELPILELRVKDFSARGLVKRPEQSFSELYTERLPLYKKYADISIECSTKDEVQICSEIISDVKRQCPEFPNSNMSICP